MTLVLLVTVISIVYLNRSNEIRTRASIADDQNYCVNQPSCCNDIITQLNAAGDISGLPDDQQPYHACDWPVRGYCQKSICDQLPAGKKYRGECGWYYSFHDIADDPGHTLGTNTAAGYGCMIGASPDTMVPIYTASGASITPAPPTPVATAVPTLPPPTVTPLLQPTAPPPTGLPTSNPNNFPSPQPTSPPVFYPTPTYYFGPTASSHPTYSPGQFVPSPSTYLPPAVNNGNPNNTIPNNTNTNPAPNNTNQNNSNYNNSNPAQNSNPNQNNSNSPGNYQPNNNSGTGQNSGTNQENSYRAPSTPITEVIKQRTESFIAGLKEKLISFFSNVLP